MYTAQRNYRILLPLLKDYGVRHVVISPGARNIPFVKSVEDDPDFTCYSVVDERGAAYFAIGIYLETGEPVALSCTSGQATRNYLPGLTEAYYRQAPIVAIMGDYPPSQIDQLNMQCVRQSSVPSDTAKVTVTLPVVKDDDDARYCVRLVNQALTALTLHGGGPVQVNVPTIDQWARGRDRLEKPRRIWHHSLPDQDWPSLGRRSRVMVVVGQHSPFTASQQAALDSFSEATNSIVFVSHLSNYHGPRSVHGNPVLQRLGRVPSAAFRPDVVISIGGLLGDYDLRAFLSLGEYEHWRVGPDGEIRDTYGRMTRVFECDDEQFFRRMAESLGDGPVAAPFFDAWAEAAAKVEPPDGLPLSQAYVAQALAPRLPAGCVLHLGILNSLRHWDMVPLDPSIRVYSNVAGFGIDGSLSTFLGHAVATERTSVLVIGDLSFFYDMNAIGNRHIKGNARILVVNNGGGAEFRMTTNAAYQFGERANRFTAAAGHFGAAREWAEASGFRYVAARSTAEFDDGIGRFLEDGEAPVLFEVFVTMEDDTRAVELMRSPARGSRWARSVGRRLPPGLKAAVKRLIGMR
ncbi:MAG: 2-succinyl-5-enolpyruvyl-6-hydroxy-3-cyclohexene-1-carboxylate synthase [Bifidobacteriaceae bacterium]|nr:2-succinyl-5-enolpyruvyl-6-hydroxy-3-cyclohexene-1-carboxylate synthase [Bifidobacteriaceae bacterium]